MEMELERPQESSGTATPTQNTMSTQQQQQYQQQRQDQQHPPHHSQQHQYQYQQSAPSYRPTTPNDRPRSVSIQSLISSPIEHRSIISPASTPGATPGPEYHGVKRKGLESEDDDEEFSGRVVIDDPDVRIAAEALGDLRAGEYYQFVCENSEEEACGGRGMSEMRRKN